MSYLKGTKAQEAKRTIAAVNNDDANDGLTTSVDKHSKTVSLPLGASQEEEEGVVEAWLQIPALAHQKPEEVIVMSGGGAQEGAGGGGHDGFLVDTDFPATNAALYHTPSEVPAGAPLNVAWQRLNGQLFLNTVQSGDIVPGQLNDSWFLGAMAAIAARKELLFDLFVSDEHADQGLYTFCFYKNGDWHKVVVDDQLPVDPRADRPLFGASAVPGELWPSLLEKAYAKLHGSYYALHRGSVMDALVDLTGGTCTKLLLDSKKVQRDVESGQLWRKLLRYHRWGYVVACKCPRANKGAVVAGDGAGAQQEHEQGVLKGHVYSIVDVSEVSNGERLVRLRNPWGPQWQWQGPWADGSEEWIRQENAGLQAELGYEFSDDGTFWMSYGDFVSVFRKIYVSRIFPHSWHHLTLKCGWLGQSAGGAPVFKGRPSGTWCNNPQFRFTVRKVCEVQLSLMQRDSRVAKGGHVPRAERDLQLGMVVIRASRDARGRKWHLVDQDVLKESELSADRERTLSLQMDPGYSYLVAPYTATPGQEGPFIMRAFSSAQVEVERLPNPMQLVVEGAWKQHTAGGRRFYSSWGSNPQWMVTSEHRATMMMVLQRTDRPEWAVDPPAGLDFDPAKAIGLCLTLPEQTREGTGRRLMIDDESQVVGESDFTSMHEAVFFVTINPGTQYLICPSSAQPGLQAPFQLSIYSSAPVECAPFPETQSTVLHGEWTAQTSGGNDLHPTWDANPKYRLSVPAAGRFRVSLYRPDGRWKRGMSLDNMIGFYVLKMHANNAHAVDHKRVIAEAPFVPMSELAEEVDLDPRYEYIVMPCTYAPRKTGKFTIAVTSEGDFTFEELPPAPR